MKKKRIFGQEFGWNATAYGGKGHWFTLDNGRFGRPANQQETDKLEPSASTTYAVEYSKAQKIKKEKFRDLIAHNIMEGRGVLGGTKKAVSEKVGGLWTRIKEKFDPLNIASFLMGRSRLGTSLVGSLMGRTGADMEYFAGKGKKGTRGKKGKDPWFTTVSAGRITPVRRDDGVADVFAKMYNLFKGTYDWMNKQRELQRNFSKVMEEKEAERFEKLLDAMLGGRVKGREPKLVSEEKPKSFLSEIKDALENVFKKIVEGLGSFIKKFVEGTFLKAITGIIGSAIRGIFNTLFGWIPKLIIRGLAGLFRMGGPLFVGLAAAAATLLEEYLRLSKADKTAKEEARLGHTAEVTKQAEELLNPARMPGATEGFEPNPFLMEKEVETATKKYLRDANTPESLKALQEYERNPPAEFDVYKKEPLIESKREQLFKYKPMFAFPDTWLKEKGFTPEEINQMYGTANVPNVPALANKIDDVIHKIDPYLPNKGRGIVLPMSQEDTDKKFGKLVPPSMDAAEFLAPITINKTNNQASTMDAQEFGFTKADVRNSDDTLLRSSRNSLSRVMFQ